MADIKEQTENTPQPWMQSYGLTPTSVTAVSAKETPVTFNFTCPPPLPVLTMPPPPEDSTQKVLFLLDRYGISDEFYHELAQVRNRFMTNIK